MTRRPNLNTLTVAELKGIASRLGIRTTAPRKAQLIKLIEEKRGGSDSELEATSTRRSKKSRKSSSHGNIPQDGNSWWLVLQVMGEDESYQQQWNLVRGGFPQVSMVVLADDPADLRALQKTSMVTTDSYSCLVIPIGSTPKVIDASLDSPNDDTNRNLMQKTLHDNSDENVHVDDCKWAIYGSIDDGGNMNVQLNNRKVLKSTFKTLVTRRRVFKSFFRGPSGKWDGGNGIFFFTQRIGKTLKECEGSYSVTGGEFE